MIILAGDHIYKMDYEKMLQQHVEQGADVTIGCLEVSKEEAPASASCTSTRPIASSPSSRSRRIRRRCRAATTAASPRWASMSSKPTFLWDQLQRDAADPHSSRDFGKDIIPYIVKHGKAVAHHFSKSCVTSRQKRKPYWRDVGTVDAYWEGQHRPDDVVPELDLYDSEWPIWTMRDHPAGEVRPRHRRPARLGGVVAGVGRLHRLGRLPQALAAVHRGADQLLFAGREHRHPAAEPGRAGGAADQLRGRCPHHHSRRAGGGRGSELDALRFRRTDKGICLITQPMIDLLGK